MIAKYFEDHIQVADSVSTWEQSIELAAEKLLQKEYITKDYIQSMIENINKNGPYVVIMPEVAIPHSRPEDGAHRTTISLLKLHEPVSYPEDKDIKLVFVLAATDNDSHVELISSLTDLLMDSEKVDQIKEAQTEAEILRIIESVVS